MNLLFTEQNILGRLANGYFEDMCDTINIDEKLFYLTKVKRSCWIKKYRNDFCKRKHSKVKTKIETV